MEMKVKKELCEYKGYKIEFIKDEVNFGRYDVKYEIKKDDEYIKLKIKKIAESKFQKRK